MAGTIPGFDADEVRAGLKFAMQIGLPPDVDDRPLFVWDPPADITATEDEAGIPFSWDAEAPPAPTPPRDPVRVDCAIEYIDSAGMRQPWGPMASSRLVLTLLDVDYVQIEGFSRVIIGGNEYEYQRTEPPVGLDVIGVWQIHVRTDDEG